MSDDLERGDASASQAPQIIVREVFTIPGRGTAVLPEEGLPPEFFGLAFDLDLTASDGSQRRAKGMVESLLLSVNPPQEVLTYLVRGVSASDIPPGTIIQASGVELEQPLKGVQDMQEPSANAQPSTSKTSRIRILIAIILGGLVFAYTVGVVLGAVEGGQRIDAVHLGLIALTALTIALLLIPEAFGHVKLIEMAGFKVEMREIKERQAEQRALLEDIKLIVPLLLPEPEQRHLLNLAEGTNLAYKRTGLLQSELRHLRSLGLIRMRQNQTVGQLPSEFNLTDQIELTDRGRRWVARYREIEPIGS